MGSAQWLLATLSWVLRGVGTPAGAQDRRDGGRPRNRFSPNQESWCLKGACIRATPPSSREVPRAASWCPGVNICQAD